MLNRPLGFTVDKPGPWGFYDRERTAGPMGSNKILSLVTEHGQDCRRQWPRQLMLMSARLLTTTTDKNISIRDLAPGGARIEGSDIPPVGTDVLLKRGEFEAFGTIAWHSGTHAGIEFEAELDDEAYEALHQPQQPAQTVVEAERTRRPGFGRKQRDHARWSNGSGWIDL